MKYLVVFFLTFNVFALKAIIKVLEAPIYHKEDTNSIVLQNVRKGSVIYVNGNSLRDLKRTQDREFIQTFTRDGRVGFIESRYIKVIYENLRELTSSIAIKEDPTDYILQEPVPSNYPFETYINRKASFSFFFQPVTKNAYDYIQNQVKESSNPSAGIELSLRRRGNFDLTDRYYHGFMISFQTSGNEFQFADEIFSEESHIRVGFGSNISYAFYKRRMFQVESHLKIQANYHRAVVTIEDLSDDGLNYEEQKIFSGFSFQSNISLAFRHIDFFGSKTMDLIHGPGMIVTLPYSLKTDGFSDESYWSSTEYSSSLSSEFIYNVGISYSF